MSERIKVLTLFETPWHDRSNISNSFSNILGGDIYEIKNIYTRKGKPQTNDCKDFFQITEKDILKNLINKKHKTGKRISIVSAEQTNDKAEASLDNRLFFLIKKYRFTIMFWIQNLIWSFNNWKSSELKEFIDEFQPDIIFFNIGSKIFLNRIAVYLKTISGAKMVGYIWDDIYTLKQVSFSPFYWINRLSNRHYIRKVVEECDQMYAINDEIKKEYEYIFNKEFLILRKGVKTNSPINDYKFQGLPIKIVYTGNINSGRHKTLQLIAEAIDVINTDGEKFKLYITTGNYLSDKLRRKIELSPNISIRNIPFDKIKVLQKNADILLNVEPFSIFHRYKWRLSFSTKIVDYFEAGRCIMSIGWNGCSTQKYLYDNDVAIVVDDKNRIISTLEKILLDTNIIKIYSEKSLLIGIKRHEIGNIRSNLHERFRKVIK